jgi:hypothetical protein
MLPSTPSKLSDSVFSRSIHLLSLLNNPLNLELLSSNILQSTAIWPAESSTPRYLRILSGFRSCLHWKLTDLKEGKGGIGLDEWILAVGRGASGNSMQIMARVDVGEPWKHLLLFSGLRSGVTEEEEVSRSAVKALEHAFVRAFKRAVGEANGNVSESMFLSDCADEVMMFSLALMDHMNSGIIASLLSAGDPEATLLFLVSGMYSPASGLFRYIPNIMSSLQTSQDSLSLAQSFTSNILQPYVASISNITSRVFAAIRHPQALILGLDMYISPRHSNNRILASTLSMHDTFAGLSDQTTQVLLTTAPSLNAQTDVISILWENLKRYLFAAVMSLRGVITNLIHSSAVGNGTHSESHSDPEYAGITFEILEIFGNISFITARFGYASFDEWKFVYLASIDILSAYPIQATHFLERHIPGPPCTSSLTQIPLKHTRPKPQTRYSSSTH